MRRQQRAYCRKSVERTPLGFPSLKPFLLLGETGPCLCFGQQEAFQLGRRRFLGKLRTPRGMLVEFFGTHATLSPTNLAPVLDGVTHRSLIARSALRQFFARAIHTHGRYGSAVPGSVRVGAPWQSWRRFGPVSFDGGHYPRVVPEISSDHTSPSSFAF
jgi:hypothetical protein